MFATDADDKPFAESVPTFACDSRNGIEHADSSLLDGESDNDSSEEQVFLKNPLNYKRVTILVTEPFAQTSQTSNTFNLSIIA